LLHAEEALGLRQESRTFPSWTLTPRQLCDLELLLSGGFAPLTGFLGRADHASRRLRDALADGTLWPIPVVLDVDEAFADGLARGTASPCAIPRG
jgi:sulfate adenylyltransferase